MEAKSIERIAEELGVNFYDLHPLISARDNFMKQEGIREVVEWLRTYGGELYLDEEFTDKRYCITSDVWQAKLKEWGIK